MFLIYDFLYILFSFLYLPYLVLKRKGHKKFWTRFGFLRKEEWGLQDKKRIWIHAVSVGEVLVVKNLLSKLRVSFPNHQIILSVVTQTGFQLAQTIVTPDEVLMYAPVDLSFAVRRYLDIVQPHIYLNAETEIWPNLFTELSRRAIPIVQINGRISDKAFKGYKLFKHFLAPIVGAVSCFCMQSETDAKRIRELGALSENVFVAGNMKFDDILEQREQALPEAFREKKGLMFVAGSTHPGEEAIILDIAYRLRARFPGLCLVLAPRHPDRAQEIILLCEDKGFKAVRFSQLKEKKEPEAVVVMDTIGHLRSLYPLADVVFLGKSLSVKGGHNIIEPAYYGKPVIVGPFMQNFRDVTKLFLENKAVVQVEDKAGLEEMVVKLLSDQELRQSLGVRAQAVIAQNKGATEKTLSMISAIMGGCS